MPSIPSLSITIRPCYLFSSTIVGFARIVIDQEILLKEMPIFRSGYDVMVQISAQQVAACRSNLDVAMLNRMVWSFRELIETAIVNEWHKKNYGT